MPLTASTGIFPGKSSMLTQSRGDLERLFFSATSENVYDGRQLTKVDQNENLSEIVNVGQRTTKYLPFRYSTAPLPPRGACRYTQELGFRPLGDNVINSNFAATMKEPPVVRLPSDGTRPLHADSWRTFSTSEMHESKPGLAFYSMGKTNTLKDMGAKMDKLSDSHRRHHGRSESFCRPESAPPGIDNLYMSGRGGSLGTSLRAGDCYRTMKQNDFWDYRFLAGDGRPPTSSAVPTRQL
mmetsp:Transcript_50649/g.120879  ORF Transcript_50649/g.120879 Transcript_50649/m.120879 type:complete len:239 (+) Transcript_50649:48-764(+)